MTEVYNAINAVQADLARAGIGKDSRNQAQGYAFRGIDSVYNSLAPLLARHHLCMLPRLQSRECVERQSAKGGVLFYVTVCADFDLISSVDGSTHTIRTYGEAMDSGDKATNKAMSAAYKYAAIMAFCVPTEGDNDADATTHEIVSQQSAETAKIVATIRRHMQDGDMPAALDAIAHVRSLGQPETSRAVWQALAPEHQTAISESLKRSAT